MTCLNLCQSRPYIEIKQFVRQLMFIVFAQGVYVEESVYIWTKKIFDDYFYPNK